MGAKARNDVYSTSAGGTVFDRNIGLIRMLSSTAVVLEYCSWLTAADAVRDMLSKIMEVSTMNKRQLSISIHTKITRKYTEYSCIFRMITIVHSNSRMAAVY